MDTNLLAQLVNAKLNVLQKVLELSERQLPAVQAEDLTGLLSLLAAKQQVLDILQKLDTQLEPYRHEEPEARQWESEALKIRCRQQAERCEALLKEILTCEKRAESAMMQRRGHIADDLSALQKNAEAQRAYIQQPANESTAYEFSAEG